MRAVPGERTKILYNLATIFPTFLWFFFGVRKLACALTDSEQTPREEKRQQAKGPSGNKVYILLLAPRPAGKARATSIPAAVCKERATQPAGLRAAARRGAAAGGHLRRCRSSTMSPHRLRGGALHLPARPSRQNAHLIS